MPDTRAAVEREIADFIAAARISLSKMLEEYGALPEERVVLTATITAYRELANAILSGAYRKDRPHD